MSVPIRNRSESEIDYHYDAVMADQSLIQLALRNFGVKDKIRSVDFYINLEQEYQKEQWTLHQGGQSYMSFRGRLTQFNN